MGENVVPQARARLLQLMAEGAVRAIPAVCRGCGREFDVSGHAPGQSVACPACRAQIEAPAPPQSTPGRYRILETIGRGAMGVVYRAEDSALRREVALKVVSRASVASAGHLERFRREAHAMAQVDHPNVVKLFDVGEHDGDPYLVMELIRGEKLGAAFARRPLRARVELVEEVARGVKAVHERGIIHRDLKPENVLIDAAGRPHVMDFGLARLEEGAPLTRDGLAIGTPPYMAPEQVRGGVIDARTDVFALGAMLYEALTAIVPHRGATVAETFHAILTLDAVPPRQLNARVPGDLETVCLRAIEKDPAARYPSADAFADDLRRWLDGEAIQARPPSVLQRAVRLLNRHRAVATPVGVAVAGALAVSIVLQTMIPRMYTAESNFREAQERARMAEIRGAALARVNGALDQALELVYDGAATSAELRLRAQEARQVAQDIAQYLPTLLEARVAHGRALRLLGDEAGALEDFDRALRRHPEFGHAHFERGRLRLERAMRSGATDELARAAEDFDAAVRYGMPSRREIDIARLYALFLKGRREEAVAGATRVIDLGGQVEDYLALRGMARTDPRAAVDDFTAALHRRPNDAALLFARARSRLALRDPAGAVRDLERALELRVSFPEADALIAEIRKGR